VAPWSNRTNATAHSLGEPSHAEGDPRTGKRGCDVLAGDRVSCPLGAGGPSPLEMRKPDRVQASDPVGRYLLTLAVTQMPDANGGTSSVPQSAARPRAFALRQLRSLAERHGFPVRSHKVSAKSG
jgi:hypothetical protein